MSLILVIDAGTSEFKAVLFNDRLQIEGSAGNEFTVDHPAADLSIFDALDYWESCIDTVREAISQGSVNPRDVAAVAVTSHTDTLFPLDASGNPVSEAILWTDPRAKDEAQRIQERFGLERIFRTTGQTGASYIHFASRLSWFLVHNQSLAKNVRYFLQTQDYLIYQLTGRAVMDHSVASSSLFGYLETSEYWPDMLDFVGVDPDRLSAIIEPGQIAGELRGETARKLGLKPGIPVIAGGMDAIAAAVAMDNVRPGVVTEITGSALVIAATSDTPKFDNRVSVPCFPHAVPGKYLLMPWCETAGMALKWYRDQFFKSWEDVADLNDTNLFDFITAEAAEIDPGCDGVTVLPHFSGSGSPDFNPEARAVIYGLTLAHKRGHISRAFLESVAFLLKVNLNILTKMGVAMERIISSGGGSRSPLWCQIKADVTGIPLTVSDVPEATALGAAILTARTLDWPTDVPVTAGHKGSETYEPNPEMGGSYCEAFQRFVDLDRLLPLRRENRQ